MSFGSYTFLKYLSNFFKKIIVGPGPDPPPSYMYGEGFQVGKIWGGGKLFKMLRTLYTPGFLLGVGFKNEAFKLCQDLVIFRTYN